MSAGSGRTSSAPFATYDRASCSWRTSQPSLFEDLPAALPTWPKSGTWDLGAACELPTSALPTGASAFSSPPGLLPTPRVQDHGGMAAADPPSRVRGPDNPDGHSPNLMTVVSLLKTPTAQLAVNGGSQHPDKRTAGGHGPTLADQVEHLLPTPRATDGTKGGPGQRGSSGDLMLPSAVMLLPTPTAMDSHGARNATANRSAVKPATNNDGWTLCDVFWTGETTRWPSAAGKPSSDGQHPGQLSLDGPESD
jgi:hypothetical protein